MTISTEGLASLFALNLKDATNRSILADALTDLGRVREAARLRGEFHFAWNGHVQDLRKVVGSPFFYEYFFTAAAERDCLRMTAIMAFQDLFKIFRVEELRSGCLDCARYLNCLRFFNPPPRNHTGELYERRGDLFFLERASYEEPGDNLEANQRLPKELISLVRTFPYVSVHVGKEDGLCYFRNHRKRPERRRE